jgi:hypothetical protein
MLEQSAKMQSRDYGLSPVIKFSTAEYLVNRKVSTTPYNNLCLNSSVNHVKEGEIRYLEST